MVYVVLDITAGLAPGNTEMGSQFIPVSYVDYLVAVRVKLDFCV